MFRIPYKLDIEEYNKELDSILHPPMKFHLWCSVMSGLINQDYSNDKEVRQMIREWYLKINKAYGEYYEISKDEMLQSENSSSLATRG